MRWTSAVFLVLCHHASVDAFVPRPSLSGGSLSTRHQSPPICSSFLAVANKEKVDDFETEIELIEDDDEEFDLEEALAQWPIWEAELQQLSRTSRQDPDATKKAQAVFDKMFEAYVMGEDSALWPHAGIYNLLIETHAYSRLENGAEEAEHILSRMEDMSVDFVARPNRETYISVMDAWAMRNNPEKAAEVIDRLQAVCDEKDGDEAFEPNADVYNKLIKAYGVVEDYDEVESIFQRLLEEEGSMKANYKTWVQAMKAFVSQSGGMVKIQSMIRDMNKAYRMGEEEYEPRTDVFNVLIRSYVGQKGGAANAETMLYELMDKYRQGDEALRPNAETFLATILSFKRRSDIGAAAKVETLLMLQDGVYRQSKAEDLKPTLRLFNAVLTVLSRSKDDKKAVRAKRVFDKLKQSGIEPNESSYYLLLKACAHTKGDPETIFAAFQIAVGALQEFRENYDCDSDCFGMFLRACGNLMPTSRKRDSIVQGVFQKCCKSGYVNNFVMKEFENAASEELLLEILGGFLEDGVKAPKAWSINTVR